MKRLLFLTLCFMVMPLFLHADTITLKDGTIIEGTIVEKAEGQVKIEISGTTVTYFLDGITAINNQTLMAPSPLISNTVRVIEKTSAPETPTPELPTLTAQGIFRSDTDYYAIINNKIVREGDTINGATVTRIGQNDIELDVNGQTLRLSTRTKFITKPTSQTTSKNDFFKNLLTELLKQSGKTPSLSNEQIEKFIAVFGAFFVIILVIALAGYVYSSLCLFLIAKKTSVEPAWLAWIPIANAFLMCKIASLSYWWLLTFFIGLIPIVGTLATVALTIFFWYKIALARNKPGWLGVLMIIPLANMIVMGYLAFSE
ncbi:MAG: hypothetical protein KBA46_06895 [Candidatus Omnitrophica bacterium]|nr:hypothetical protein [Candidatus Omnitrophota bacterium]